MAYDYAENELTRMTEAFNANAANMHELDQARTNERTLAEGFRVAQYGQEIARYELQVARSALLYAQGQGESDERTRMPLHSPIDGAVLRVMQKSVAVVTPGTPLIEVGDPRDLELVIDVLSTDAVKIKPGQPVIIEHWGGTTPLQGTVRLVEPSAFTKVSALGIEEQRVNVIADFLTPPQDRASLGDGFRIESSIVIWEHPQTLQIPSSAAFRRGDQWATFVIEHGRAMLRDIQPGRQNGRTIQILSGLTEGDRVVLHPSDRLSSGLRVIERQNRQ